jgi:hypothetical protein
MHEVVLSTKAGLLQRQRVSSGEQSPKSALARHGFAQLGYWRATRLTVEAETAETTRRMVAKETRIVKRMKR